MCFFVCAIIFLRLRTLLSLCVFSSLAQPIKRESCIEVQCSFCVPAVFCWSAGTKVRGSNPEGKAKSSHAQLLCNERKVHRKSWFVLAEVQCSCEEILPDVLQTRSAAERFKKRMIQWVFTLRFLFLTMTQYVRWCVCVYHYLGFNQQARLSHALRCSVLVKSFCYSAVDVVWCRRGSQSVLKSRWCNK